MGLHIGPSDSNIPVGGPGGPEGPSSKGITDSLVTTFMKAESLDKGFTMGELPPGTVDEKVLNDLATAPSLLQGPLEPFTKL